MATPHTTALIRHTAAAGWQRARGLIGTALLMVSTALLVACGGGSEAAGSDAKLRLLNASAGYSALDLLVDDSRKLTSVGYGTQSGYINVKGGSAVTTALANPGASSVLSTTSRSFSKDVSYTLIAYGWQGALKTELLQDDVAAADSGKSKLQVKNLASDAGAVDVYLTGTDQQLVDAAPVAAAVAGGGTAGYVSVSAGTYRLRVTAAGDKNDLRLDVASLSLPSTQVASLVLTPTAGGVLVNGLISVQKGALSTLANTKARARIVGSVLGNGRITSTVGGTLLANGQVSPQVGLYQQVAGGDSVPVALSVNGSAFTVPAQALPAGGDYTLLVTGTAAAPQLLVLTDDNRLPVVSTNAKLRLLHAVNGLASGLTLSANLNTVASEVQPNTASAYANLVGSSTTRLEVRSPLSATALYAVSDAPVRANGVFTVFVLGDAGAPVTILNSER